MKENKRLKFFTPDAKAIRLRISAGSTINGALTRRQKANISKMRAYFSMLSQISSPTVLTSGDKNPRFSLNLMPLRMGASPQLFILFMLLVIATACTPRGVTPEDLPTAITDLDALATQVVLTENAPPEGFRDSISVPEIDTNLDELSNWRYTVTLEFDGFFADTPRPASASTSATVWYDQFGSERRVVVTAEGELLAGGDEAQTVEGVRIGNDTFLVRNGTCQQMADSETPALADVGAGELIGGVFDAVPDATKAVINGEEVWRYAFLQSDLNITSSIQINEGGAMTLLGGELWFAPEHNAVIRFYLTLDVENATVFGSQLPVTGQAIIRYDLYDIGIDPNISIPFGC